MASRNPADSLKSPTPAARLRDLLAQVDNISPPSPFSDSSSSPHLSDEIPKPNELYILLQSTQDISDRLRSENDELRAHCNQLQSQIVILIEENNRLHEEVRTQFISGMLPLLNIDNDGKPMTDKESQIVDFYAKQIQNLEIELQEAKHRLNAYENSLIVSHDHGDCSTSKIENNENYAYIIAENEAHKRTVQQIQIKLEQCQTKEKETLAKLQGSLTMIEQYRFENAEVIVERDQVKTELAETQNRLKALIDEMYEKINDEKQTLETMFQERVQEMVENYKQIEEKCTQHEVTIERLNNEKLALMADLNMFKKSLQHQETGLNELIDSTKLKIQNATRERDQANSNAMQIRSDFETLLLTSNQDAIQFRHQLNSLQNRLYEVQDELLISKKQCLDLVEEINRLTQENILLKSTKQSIEQSREENMETIVALLSQREQEHQAMVEKLELERQQSLSYLENLVNNQNKILNKLRLYARQVTGQIERINEENSKINHEIAFENQELRTKLSDAYERLNQVDVQLTQHTDTHSKLIQKVVDLNNRLKNTKK